MPITRTVLSSVAALLLSLHLAVAADFPKTGSIYAPNVVRRLDTTNGKQVPVVTAALKELRSRSGKEADVIDGSPRTSWMAQGKREDTTAEMEVTVDLGQSHRLGRVDVLWQDPDRMPESYEVATSPDGKEFTAIEVGKEGAAQPLLLRATIEPREARYIHVIGKGTKRHAVMQLREIMAFEHAAGRAPTTDGGYNLAFLPAVKQETSTPEQWQSFGEIVPTPTFMSYAGGSPKATVDAVGTVDLGAAYQVFFVTLDIGGRGNEVPQWGNGGKVELSADGKSWQTVHDTREPLRSTQIDLAGKPVPARYLRLTNYFAEGAGTGTGRLFEIEVFGGK